MCVQVCYTHMRYAGMCCRYVVLIHIYSYVVFIHIHRYDTYIHVCCLLIYVCRKEIHVCRKEIHVCRKEQLGADLLNYSLKELQIKETESVNKGVLYT